MKIGHMFLTPPSQSASTYRDRYNEVVKIIDYSNGKGFDGIWFTEHHFSDYGSIPNPLLFLANIARIAPEARLGTAVVLLPVWHPLRLAEDVAALDALSGGRVDLGIGRGYQSYEFTRLGSNLGDNRDAFGESLDILNEAWTKDDFAHDGRFWKFERTTVTPKPVQQPIPIWMAATSPPSIRAALARGYHVMTGTGGVFEELQQRNAYIDTVLKSLGRSPDGLERSTTRFVFCSNSRNEIDRFNEQSRTQVRVSRALSSGKIPVAGRNDPQPYVGEPDLDSWRGRLIIGTPEECIQQTKRLAKVGMTYVHGIFDVGLDHEMQMRSVKLFSEEVLPALPSINPPRLTEAVITENSRAYAERKEFHQGF